jgi:hypothetical protein
LVNYFLCFFDDAYNVEQGTKMKTKNLLNKTKILLGAGILTVGAATSIFLACKYLGNKQFQYYDFGKFT